MMLGVGLGVDGLSYAIDPGSLAALDIDAERLMRLMDEVEPRVSGDPLDLG
jgi:hypothetical protein